MSEPKTVEELIATLESEFDCQQGDRFSYHVTKDGVKHVYRSFRFAVGLPYDRAQEVMCRAIYFLISRWRGEVGGEKLRLFWCNEPKVIMEKQDFESGACSSFNGLSTIGAYSRLMVSARLVIIDPKGDEPYFPGNGQITEELLEDMGLNL